MGTSFLKMSSKHSLQDTSDLTTLLSEEIPTSEDVKDQVSDLLFFHNEEQEIDKEEISSTVLKNTSKRKRKPEVETSLNVLFEVFLRIIYPISKCMTKSVAIGLVKPLDYSPTVMLSHGSKVLVLTEKPWESFMNHLHLIECYLTNNMIGKKTGVRLLDCNIEIDIVKNRGEQMVRFRNLDKHEEKILLTREEFYILSCVTSPITRYMRQLVFSSSVIKDYLVDTMENQPDIQILHGPVDTSIFNRIPHEVEVWRRIKEYELREMDQATKQENKV